MPYKQLIVILLDKPHLIREIRDFREIPLFKSVDTFVRSQIKHIVFQRHITDELYIAIEV